MSAFWFIFAILSVCYCVYKKQSSGDSSVFGPLSEMYPSELRHTKKQRQKLYIDEKWLEKSKRYSYAVEAYKALHLRSVQPEYYFEFSVASKRKLEYLDVDKSIISAMQEDTELEAAIKDGAYNYEKLKQWTDWMKEAPEAIDIGAEEPILQKIALFFNRTAEKRHMLDIEQAVQQSVPTISIRFVYKTPKETRTYWRDGSISGEGLVGLMNECQQLEEKRQTAYYQRTLMTPALRYDIMKRDGFRCKICGRSAKDGVTLHVDHIFPVSKGGKTEPSNLRTLCDDCNLGKRDKYDYGGLN